MNVHYHPPYPKTALGLGLGTVLQSSKYTLWERDNIDCSTLVKLLRAFVTWKLITNLVCAEGLGEIYFTYIYFIIMRTLLYTLTDIKFNLILNLELG